MEAEEIPSKRFDKEEKAKKWKVTAEKPEEREAKKKEKASRKLTASHSADLKPHRREAIDKKVDKIQKVTLVIRNSPEKDIAKSKNVSKVSRGSQKLNRTIDSWSKEMRFEGQQSKDIVKDYLEGALDREGSLVRLSKLHSKLQNTSHLVRQKLVENNLSKRVNYFRYMDTCLDTPSTSSTQGSMFHTTSDSTIAATTAASQKAGKGPSLIAKLMGIEEYPSRPLQAAMKKQFDEGEKTVSS